MTLLFPCFDLLCLTLPHFAPVYLVYLLSFSELGCLPLPYFGLLSLALLYFLATSPAYLLPGPAYLLPPGPATYYHQVTALAKYYYPSFFPLLNFTFLSWAWFFAELDLLCPTFPYFTPLTLLCPSLLSVVTWLYFAFLSLLFPLPLPHFSLPLLCPTFPSFVLPCLAFTYFALLWPPFPCFLLLPSYQSSLLTYHQVCLTYLLLPGPANYYQVTPKPLTCPTYYHQVTALAKYYLLFCPTFPSFGLLCPSLLPLLT